MKHKNISHEQSSTAGFFHEYMFELYLKEHYQIKKELNTDTWQMG